LDQNLLKVVKGVVYVRIKVDVPCIWWSFAGLSPWRSGIAPRSVDVGFVVSKVALGQVFLRVLRFSLSVSFHRGSSYSCTRITWGMNDRPVGVRSTGTYSHPINMNNNNKSVKLVWASVPRYTT
jgi:hypothetical protein